MVGFLTHVRVMASKQCLVVRRNWQLSLMQVCVTPVLVCFFLFTMQAITDRVTRLEVPHPPTITVPPLQRCNFPADGCTSLLYMPASSLCATCPPDDWIEPTMRSIATKNGLDFGVDVAAVDGSSSTNLRTDLCEWTPSDSSAPIPSAEQRGPSHAVYRALLAQRNASDLPPGPRTRCSLAGAAHCVGPSIATPLELFEDEQCYCLPCDLLEDWSALTATLSGAATRNRTKNVVLWLTPYFSPWVTPLVAAAPGTTARYQAQIAALRSYAIFFNITNTIFPLADPQGGAGSDAGLLAVKKAVDEAIITAQAGAATLSDDLPAFDLTLRWKTFPRAAPRITGYDVVAQVRFVCRCWSGAGQICLHCSPTPVCPPLPTSSSSI